MAISCPSLTRHHGRNLVELRLLHSFVSSSSPLLYAEASFPLVRAGGTRASIRASKARSANSIVSEKQVNERYNAFASEGRIEDENRRICPGCGVFMQNSNPDLPGYFKEKTTEAESRTKSALKFFKISRKNEEEKNVLGSECSGFISEGQDKNYVIMNDLVDDLEERDKDDAVVEKADEVGETDGIHWDICIEGDVGNEDSKKAVCGSTPANLEGRIGSERKENISKSVRKWRAREAQKDQFEETVCARCYSLRHYGRVKNQSAEKLISDFDFDRLITTRIMKLTPNVGAVVVMVVDCVDFDGSFPKRAAKSLFKALDDSEIDAKFVKLPKLILVATKIDLLPRHVSLNRLDRWVRSRSRAGGALKLSGVFLVSSLKDWGVRDLLSSIKEMAGPRGNMWLIGAQNAGKSSLINIIAKKQGVKMAKLTEASLPGTTLGILRIRGILPANAKLYDTPGILHPYLVSLRLNREEFKMVEIRKELRPRTYRIKAGQAIHVGALARVDLIKTSVETIYITVWASRNASLHMGKIENTDSMRKTNFGITLQPPVGPDRVSELGEWKQNNYSVSGTTWEVNSTDIAIAGLGWFSFVLKGEAEVTVWTYDGIEITQREPLVLDRAESVERAGFLLPPAVSDAIGKQARLDNKKRIQAEENNAVVKDS